MLQFDFARVEAIKAKRITPLIKNTLPLPEKKANLGLVEQLQFFCVQRGEYPLVTNITIRQLIFDS
jgi:hypothetical protein